MPTIRATLDDLGVPHGEGGAEQTAAALQHYFSADLPNGRFLAWLILDDGGEPSGIQGNRDRDGPENMRTGRRLCH